MQTIQAAGQFVAPNRSALKCFTYESCGHPVNDIGLIEPPPVIRKRRPDVHGGLLVPVGQEVVEAVVAEGLHLGCSAVPHPLKRFGGPYNTINKILITTH